MNRLEIKFNELKTQNQKALSIFITAGSPEFEISKKAIIEANKAGADIIEIGIPFTDSFADDTVIQINSTIAIKNRMSPYRVVNLIKELRHLINIPIVCRSYINLLLSYGYRYGNDYNGFERFVTEAKLAGIDALIVEDIPFVESEQLRNICKHKGVHWINTITKLTSVEQLQSICKDSSGFIYCLADDEEILNQVRSLTKTPLLTYNINSFQNFDGVILSSSIMDLMLNNKLNDVIDLIHTTKNKL